MVFSNRAFHSAQRALLALLDTRDPEENSRKTAKASADDASAEPPAERSAAARKCILKISWFNKNTLSRERVLRIARFSTG